HVGPVTIAAVPSSLPHQPLPRSNPVAPPTCMLLKSQEQKLMSPSINQTSDRAAVNKANAQKSTGPRTEAGKQRSKLNALRHGLTGQTVVLPSDDLIAYQRHCQQLHDQYHPKNPMEVQLTQAVADLSWRLNRITAIETKD